MQICLGERRNSESHRRSGTKAFASFALIFLLLTPSCAHKSLSSQRVWICASGEGWGSLEEGSLKRNFRYEFATDIHRRRFRIAIEVPFGGEELVEVDFSFLAKGRPAQVFGARKIISPAWAGLLGEFLHLVHSPKKKRPKGWSIVWEREGLRLIGPGLAVRYFEHEGFFKRQVLSFGEEKFTVRLFVRSCQVRAKLLSVSNGGSNS